MDSCQPVDITQRITEHVWTSQRSGLTTQCSLQREAASSLGDALRYFLPSAVSGQRRSLADGAQSRQLKLEGDLFMLGNWTCEGGCKPPHEREDKTPGVHNRPHCIENSQAGPLHLREDIDLGCLDSNVTCDDIEADEKLQNPEKLYSECTLDPELLQGECTHLCRFQRHPTKRCEYWFDRNNKYGMHGHEGMYGFGHCVWFSGCPEDNNATTEEMNYLICNTTETHAEIYGLTTTFESSTTTTTTTTTSTTTLESSTTTSLTTTLRPASDSDFMATASGSTEFGFSNVPPQPEERSAPVAASSSASEESGGFGLGAIIGAAVGGGVLVCIFAALIAFFMLRRKRSQEHYAENMQVNGTVVVGRPVPGIAPPAGHGKKGEEDGTGFGGEEDGNPDEKVAQGQKVKPSKPTRNLDITV